MIEIHETARISPLADIAGLLSNSWAEILSNGYALPLFLQPVFSTYYEFNEELGN